MVLKNITETNISANKLGEFTKAMKIDGEIIKIVIEKGGVDSMGELTIINDDSEVISPNPILLKQDIQVLRPRVPVVSRYNEANVGGDPESERMVHSGTFFVRGRALGPELVLKRITFLVKTV